MYDYELAGSSLDVLHSKFLTNPLEEIKKRLLITEHQIYGRITHLRGKKCWWESITGGEIMLTVLPKRTSVVARDLIDVAGVSVSSLFPNTRRIRPAVNSSNELRDKLRGCCDCNWVSSFTSADILLPERIDAVSLLSTLEEHN